MLCESNAFEAALAVWGNKSLFIHTTRSPGRTVSVAGSKRIRSITMTCVAGSASVALQDTASATARIIARSTTALAQFALQMLRMLQVRDKRGPHLDEERLQLSVLRARNQGLVERAQNALVIRDLMIDVRPIERLVLERLEIG